MIVSSPSYSTHGALGGERVPSTTTGNTSAAGQPRRSAATEQLDKLIALKRQQNSSSTNSHYHHSHATGNSNMTITASIHRSGVPPGIGVGVGGGITISSSSSGPGDSSLLSSQKAGETYGMARGGEGRGEGGGSFSRKSDRSSSQVANRELPLSELERRGMVGGEREGRGSSLSYHSAVPSGKGVLVLSEEQKRQLLQSKRERREEGERTLPPHVFLSDPAIVGVSSSTVKRESEEVPEIAGDEASLLQKQVRHPSDLERFQMLHLREPRRGGIGECSGSSSSMEEYHRRHEDDNIRNREEISAYMLDPRREEELRERKHVLPGVDRNVFLSRRGDDEDRRYTQGLQQQRDGLTTAAVAEGETQVRNESYREMDENLRVCQDVIGSVLSSPRQHHHRHSSSSRRATDEEKSETYLWEQQGGDLRYSEENSEVREEQDRMMRARERGRDENFVSSSSHHLLGNATSFPQKGKGSSSSRGGENTHRPLRNGREEEEEQVTLATATLVEDESSTLINSMMLKEREREGLHSHHLHNRHYQTSAPSSLLLQQLSHNQPLPSNHSPASYCTDEDERMVRDLLKDADITQAALAALSAAEVAAATASTNMTTTTRVEYGERANLPQEDSALLSSAYDSRVRGGTGGGEVELPSDQGLHGQRRLHRRKEEVERLIGRRILETETESVLVIPSSEGTTVQNIHEDIILNHDERLLHITMDKRVAATAYPTTGRDPGLPGMIVESCVTTSIGEREGEAQKSSIPSSSASGVPLPSSSTPLPYSPTQPVVLEEKDLLRIMQQKQQQQSLLSQTGSSSYVASFTAGRGGGQERKDMVSPEESPYTQQQSHPPSVPPHLPSSSSRQPPYPLSSSNSSLSSSPPPVVSSSSSQPPGSSSAYIRGKGPSTATGTGGCSFQHQSQGQQRQPQQQTSLYHSSHPGRGGTGNGPCSSSRPLSSSSSLGRHSSGGEGGGNHSYDASHHPHPHPSSSTSSYHQQCRGGREGSSGFHENHMGGVRSRGGRESREIGICGACDPSATGDYEGRRKGGRGASLGRGGGMYAGRELKEIIPLFKSSGLLPLTKAHKDLALRDKLVEFPKIAGPTPPPPRDSRRGSESPPGRSSVGTGSRGMSVSSSSYSSCVRPRESLMTSFDLDHILRLYLTQMAKLPQLQRFSGKWNFRFLFRHSHSSSGHGEAMMVNGASTSGTAGGGSTGGTAAPAAGVGASSTFPTSAVGLERELLRVLLREKQARELLRQHHAMWGGGDEEHDDGEKNSKGLEKSLASGGESVQKVKAKKKKRESCFEEEEEDEEIEEEDDEDDDEREDKNRIVLPPIVLPGPLQLREKGMGVAISSSRMHQALLSSFGFGEASELLHKILQPDFHFVKKKRDSRYEDEDEHDTTMMMSSQGREVASHDSIDSENLASSDERRGGGGRGRSAEERRGKRGTGERRPVTEDDDEDEEHKNPISHSTSAIQHQSSSLEERELRRLQKRFGKQTYSTVRQPRSCIYVSPASTALHPSAAAASAGSMAVCHVEGLVVGGGGGGAKSTGKNEDDEAEEEQEHHTREGHSEGEEGLVGGELVATAKFVDMIVFGHEEGDTSFLRHEEEKERTEENNRRQDERREDHEGESHEAKETRRFSLASSLSSSSVAEGVFVRCVIEDGFDLLLEATTLESEISECPAGHVAARHRLQEQEVHLLQQLFELLTLRHHVDLNTQVSSTSSSSSTENSSSSSSSSLGSSLFYLPYLLDAHVPASCGYPLEYESQFCALQELQFFPQRHTDSEVEKFYSPLRLDVLKGRMCTRWMISGVYTVPKGRRLLDRAFQLFPESLSSSFSQAFFSSPEILKDICCSVDAALADYHDHDGRDRDIFPSSSSVDKENLSHSSLHVPSPSPLLPSSTNLQRERDLQKENETAGEDDEVFSSSSVFSLKKNMKDKYDIINSSSLSLEEKKKKLLEKKREKARKCLIPTAVLLAELLRLQEPTRPPPTGSSLLRLLLKQDDCEHVLLGAPQENDEERRMEKWNDDSNNHHDDLLAKQQEEDDDDDASPSSCRLYVHLIWRVLYLASHDANPRESASSAAFLLGVSAYMSWGFTSDDISHILQWKSGCSLLSLLLSLLPPPSALTPHQECTAVLPFLSLVVSGLVKIIQLLGSSSSHSSTKGQVREGEKCSTEKQEQGGDNLKNCGGERAGVVDDDHVENKNASSDTVEKRSSPGGDDAFKEKDDEKEGESQKKNMEKKGDLELLLLPLIQAVVQQARLDESRAKTITKAVMNLLGVQGAQAMLSSFLSAGGGG
ncbi:hypothetical protein CSUI_001483 [Cystoisospora suis]|uniref:Uncharacterized protein n=1 Tax=Cystoisospora suis TaxID=483139 RepID=A0A2C6LCJ8_9APIC|nr:hypothetical protein CSUI_001483 [Cystoisospora suis]